MTAEFMSAPVLPPAVPDVPALHLFDGPYVVVGGRRLEIPEGSKRLLVFVALGGPTVERRAAAGTLWPIGDDVRAAGNLRSALWRLRGAGIDLIEADKWMLRLRVGTVVDLRVVTDWAARLIEGRACEHDMAAWAWRCQALDLLPGSYDDWVVFERERLRQRLLHGLEALSRHLAGARRYAEAIEAAMATVDMDPLRESAQRVLVEVYLGEANIAQALRSYHAYRAILFREFRVQPGAALTALVEGVSLSAVGTSGDADCQHAHLTRNRLLRVASGCAPTPPSSQM